MKARIIGIALLASGFLLGLIVLVVITTFVEDNKQTPYEQGYAAGWQFSEVDCKEGEAAAKDFQHEVEDSTTISVYSDSQFDKGVEDGIHDHIWDLTGAELDACKN